VNNVDAATGSPDDANQKLIFDYLPRRFSSTRPSVGALGARTVEKTAQGGRKPFLELS
jgi:hypothetical protein